MKLVLCSIVECSVRLSIVGLCSIVKVFDRVRLQVAQARNMSIGEHRHSCVTFEILGFVWKKSLPFL